MRRARSSAAAVTVGLAAAVAVALPHRGPASAQATEAPVLVRGDADGLRLVRFDGTVVEDLMPGEFQGVRVATDGTVYAVERWTESLVRYEPSRGRLSIAAHLPLSSVDYPRIASCDAIDTFAPSAPADFVLDAAGTTACLFVGTSVPTHADDFARITVDLRTSAVRRRLLAAPHCGIPRPPRIERCEPARGGTGVPVAVPSTAFAHRLETQAGCLQLVRGTTRRRLSCARDHVRFGASPSGRYVVLGAYEDAEHDVYLRVLLVDLADGRAGWLREGPVVLGTDEPVLTSEDDAEADAPALVVAGREALVFYDEETFSLGPVLASVHGRAQKTCSRFACAHYGDRSVAAPSGSAVSAPAASGSTCEPTTAGGVQAASADAHDEDEDSVARRFVPGSPLHQLALVCDEARDEIELATTYGELAPPLARVAARLPPDSAVAAFAARVGAQARRDADLELSARDEDQAFEFSCSVGRGAPPEPGLVPLPTLALVVPRHEAEVFAYVLGPVVDAARAGRPISPATTGLLRDLARALFRAGVRATSDAVVDVAAFLVVDPETPCDLRRDARAAFGDVRALEACRRAGRTPLACLGESVSRHASSPDDASEGEPPQTSR